MLESKKRNKIKGNTGEQLATNFVISKGLEILERNYTTAIGEIDIIAIDKNRLVFIEVKLRKNEQFGFAAEAVTPSKIRKLNQVASQYIMHKRLFYTDVRFDVIEIYFEERKINHIENAFDSYLSY